MDLFEKNSILQSITSISTIIQEAPGSTAGQNAIIEEIANTIKELERIVEELSIVIIALNSFPVGKL